LWTPGERIVILKDSLTNSYAWEVTFYEPDNGLDTIPPAGGDVFSIFYY
jgi:hypothetical protein